MTDAAPATGVNVPPRQSDALADEALPAIRVPMTGRDPNEAHRAVTPLELLFDLSFVVAVAQSANALHHALAEGQIAYGLVAYFIVFFGVWWPWVNFTWFASAYDTDDVPYRLLTFIQIAGVLIVAAGVPRAFEEFDYSITVTGYVIMRTALVALWLRAAREDPLRRPVALRFAVAIGLIQLFWVVRLAIGPPLGIVLVFVFGVVELLIPWWAERSIGALASGVVAWQVLATSRVVALRPG